LRRSIERDLGSGEFRKDRFRLTIVRQKPFRTKQIVWNVMQPVNPELVPVGNHSTNEFGVPRREFADAEKRSLDAELPQPIKNPVRNDSDSLFLNGRIGSKVLKIESETHRPIHKPQV
jgi:hypothetical protein